MIVIGEKINGAIPKTGEAIANRDAEYIKKLVILTYVPLRIPSLSMTLFAGSSTQFRR